MRRLLKPALAFIAIGLLLYAAVYAAAENLLQRTGQSNAFFKIEQLQEDTVDWLILGASHAMPLDFADFNAELQVQTGKRIANLAAPGAGPLYNRFVLEHFLRTRRTRNVLYVVDSFAFYSPMWNEERFADAKLLRRTPLDFAIVARLYAYARRDGVSCRAVLDYGSGFSKINNRERFERDAWEGEAQFERAYRPSTTATDNRIAYLYPDGTPEYQRDRYFNTLMSLIAAAQANGARVTAIKMPLPPLFAQRLPDEAAFDAALMQRLAAAGAAYHDFAATVVDPKLYFDTDHLNRAGLQQFVARDLTPILVGRR